MRSTTTPKWDVQTVLDHDDASGSFAYTMGMDSLGLLDLHIGAGPEGVLDGDFQLSTRDLHGILRELGDDWVSGRLRAGNEKSIEVDGGLTRLDLRMGRAVPKDDVDAWGASSNQVVRVEWTVHRVPEGRRRPIARDVQELWGGRIREVLDGAEIGWGVPSFEPDRRMGPMEDWAVALSTTIVGAEPYAVADQVLEYFVECRTDTQAARFAALARPHGRVAAVAEAKLLAGRVIDAMKREIVWRREIAAWVAGWDDPSVKDVDERIWGCISDSVGALLMAAVLADVLTQRQAESAVRPWRDVPGVPVEWW